MARAAESKQVRQVIKSNSYVMSHYSLSKCAQKILNMAISKIPRKPTDIEKQISVDLTATEIKRFLDWESGTLYDYLDDIAKELTNVLIEIETTDENGKPEKEIVRPFPYAKYNDGQITIRFEQFMNKHLLNLSTCFVAYPLTSIKGLKSKFSVRMFEICNCIKFKGHEYYTLEDFKEMIGCVKIIKVGEGKNEQIQRQDAYVRYNDFKVRVLDTAKKELDAVSSISFRYETETKGRKVIGLHIYTVENNPVTAEKPITNKNGDTVNVVDVEAKEIKTVSTEELFALVDECRRFLPEDMSTADISRILEKAQYNTSVVEEKYKIAQEQKEVKNLTAWMLKAIEGNYSSKTVRITKETKKNYSQRSYDNTELEKELLKANFN